MTDVKEDALTRKRAYAQTLPMLRTVCKSKLHRATVTEANIQYTGSLTLDAQLMKAADLVPYEQVHVVDVDNGARIVTYCIEGPPGSGTVCINGAAARLIGTGDKVIIISYAQVTPEELEGIAPKVVMLDAHNRIQEVSTVACQLSEDHKIGTSHRSPES